MTASTASDTFDFLGARARVFPGGVVELVDVPAGDMPPLHVHHTHDEAFYVLAGEMTLHTPTGEVTLRAGEFFLAPRGIPHTYRVSDAGPASWLVYSTPAGLEDFIADVGALETPDPVSLGAAAHRYGIEILGPPGTMP